MIDPVAHDALITGDFDDEKQYKRRNYTVGSCGVDERLYGVESYEVKAQSHEHRYDDNAVKCMGLLEGAVQAPPPPQTFGHGIAG